jgi:hypothetical protein
MALVLGDIVSMSLEDYENQNGLLGPLVQAQPPRFGRVAAADGPPATIVDVLWDDGRFEADIPVDALDKIEPPDAGVVATLQGFMLKTNPSVAAQAESPEFQGIAIAFYTRDQNGEGSPTETLCLMRLNFFGTYRELLASTLQPVSGR